MTDHEPAADVADLLRRLDALVEEQGGHLALWTSLWLALHEARARIAQMAQELAETDARASTFNDAWGEAEAQLREAQQALLREGVARGEAERKHREAGAARVPLLALQTWCGHGVHVWAATEPPTNPDCVCLCRAVRWADGQKWSQQPQVRAPLLALTEYAQHKPECHTCECGHTQTQHETWSGQPRFKCADCDCRTYHHRCTCGRAELEAALRG